MKVTWYSKDRVLYLKDKFKQWVAQVGMKKNQMSKLDLKIIHKMLLLKLDIKDEVMIWHFQFGYLHFDGLGNLENKNMVYELLNMDFEKIFYEECVLDKQVRTLFRKIFDYCAKEQLRLINIDLYGLITA